jgi:hypothetical protein
MKKPKRNEMYEINKRINELKELSKHLGRGDVTYRNFIKSILTATASIESELATYKKDLSNRIESCAKKIAEEKINESFKKYNKKLVAAITKGTGNKRLLK